MASVQAITDVSLMSDTCDIYGASPQLCQGQLARRGVATMAFGDEDYVVTPYRVPSPFRGTGQVQPRACFTPGFALGRSSLTLLTLLT
jgi:hypothetical protein